MAEELAFQQAGGNGRAVQFDKRVGVALAKIMDCPGDQFLARARLPVNQYRRPRRSYCFDLAEDTPQHRAVADDLLEIHFAAEFIFEIELFLSQFVLEFRDLTIGKGVVDGDGNLPGDLG